MNSFQLTSENEFETISLGKKLSNLILEFNIGNPKIIFLSGELGTGKTTLSKGILEGMGYEGLVKSPTFNLVEIYEISDYSVFHFDFFRIVHAKELNEIGIQEYLTDKKSISIIEWPERANSILPKPDLGILIEHSNDLNEDARKFTINSNHDIGILLGQSFEKK